MSSGDNSGRPSSGRPRTSVGRPPSAIGPARVPPQQRQGSAAGARPRTTFGTSGGATTGAARPPSSMGGARPGTSFGGARPGSSMSMAAGQFFNSVEQQATAGTGGAATGLARPASGRRGGARVGTAAGGGAVGAARPGSRMGVGGPGPRTAGGQMNVAARPVTQQGLAGARPASGMRTAGVGGRQVLDKSYYMGLMRSKMNELATEIDRMTADIERNNEQRQHLTIYEQKAEELAQELKGHQGKLADLNLLVDKMNTNSDLGQVQMDLQQIKQQNETEATDLDALFADRRQKEEQAKQLETELENEKRDNENFLNNMDASIREQYLELKERNQTLNEELRLLEQESSQLNGKINDLEDELTGSTLKQEATVIHSRLAELEQKRAKIEEEMKAEGTIDEKRQRIMEKVKKDNDEITTINQQATELKEKTEQCNEELRELDEEMDGQQGEKNEKYRELRQKEVHIDDFLKNYEFSREEEQARVDRLTRNVVKTLSVIARNVADHDKTLATATPMNDYDLGSGGTRKQLSGTATVAELQEAHVALQEELLRVDELTEKARDESDGLEMNLAQMEQDAGRLADIAALRRNADAKRESLLKDKTELEAVLGEAQGKSNQMQSQVGDLKTKLNENDTHLQLVNLEKKLQYVEQNNFALRETIEGRKAETDIGPVREQVTEMVTDYNNTLITFSASRIGSAMTRPPQ